MNAANRRVIEKLVRSMGLIGISEPYRQFVCAIELVCENPSMLQKVTTRLYPAVSKCFSGSSSSAVEKNLRRARDEIWANCDREKLYSIIGYERKERPTTGELLDIIWFYIRQTDYIESTLWMERTNMEYQVLKRPIKELSNVPAVELRHTGWLEETPVRAWARFCHDGVNLYVALEAEESPVRATLTGKLDRICDDSCLEFFIAPLWNDARYFNFEWNLLGGLNLSFGGPRKTRVRQIVKNTEALFQPQTWQKDDHWGINFCIPAHFIQMYMPEFQLKGRCACNIYKCAEKSEQPHFMAWAPLNTSVPDFHRRDDFGALIFE